MKELLEIINANSLITEKNESEENTWKWELKSLKEVEFKSFKSKMQFDRIYSKISKQQELLLAWKRYFKYYSATQWPNLIANAVINVCGFNKRRLLFIENKPFLKKMKC